MEFLKLVLCVACAFLFLRAYNQSPQYYIVIDKSDYELRVYANNVLYQKYRVVFGSDDMRDKMYEGDRRTPDGYFEVIQKKIHNDWGPELLLDYPTEESYARFNARRDSGVIPRIVTIGSGIAIHGTTRASNDNLIDRRINWTNGCVSLKLKEMKILYKYIKTGTPVLIQQ